MGKYTVMNGVRAAAKHFSKTIGGVGISESTIHSIREAYKAERDPKRKVEEEDDVSSLPVKKRGRKLLLGEDLDLPCLTLGN